MGALAGFATPRCQCYLVVMLIVSHALRMVAYVRHVSLLLANNGLRASLVQGDGGYISPSNAI